MTKQNILNTKTNYSIEIRNDDVLLWGKLTPPMKRAMRVKPFFEWFKESDKYFEDNNIKSILAVMADGIDHHPEWVNYVKARIDRYEIALHGHTHMCYRDYTEEEGYAALSVAKEKVEKTFGIKVKRWFVPFGRGCFPEWGIRVADRLGVNFHTKNNPIPHFYFHYWNPKSVQAIKDTWEATKIYPLERFLRVKVCKIKVCQVIQEDNSKVG